jgi:hypothetical protein
MMRISHDPGDPDYVGDRTFVIVLDRLFFTAGPVLTADEKAGELTYMPVDERGHFLFDDVNGCWKVARATGAVRIFEQATRC